MANLTVKQPKIKVLKVEVSHGINIERKLNKPKDQYTIKTSKMMGEQFNTYILNKQGQDDRHFLDHLDSNHKPYVVALTLLIESPMKMYVQN